MNKLFIKILIRHSERVSKRVPSYDWTARITQIKGRDLKKRSNVQGYSGPL